MTRALTVLRAAVLEELLSVHGVRPRAHTDPVRIRAFLNDLYVFQLRELRLQRRELEAFLGPQPLEDYRQRVEALKERYRLLGLPLRQWSRPTPPPEEAEPQPQPS